MGEYAKYTNRLLKYFHPRAWWLAGGISSTNCIAAYLFKGASSYETSKTNLANLGTYTLSETGTAPSWSSAEGIIGNDQLDTGINTHLTTWSMFVKFEKKVSSANLGICGLLVSSGRFGLFHIYSSNQIVFCNVTDNARYNLPTAVGVAGLASKYGYLNATLRGTDTGGTTNQTYSIYINGTNGTSALKNPSFPIHAVSIYNTTLTEVQVTALTTAMNAL